MRRKIQGANEATRTEMRTASGICIGLLLLSWTPLTIVPPNPCRNT
jgi:hypothetical protein